MDRIGRRLRLQLTTVWIIGGRAMLPGWVDSHSHLVFAGDRAGEFVARMAGEPYAAGGIAVTVDATRTAGVDQLRELVETRVWEALLGGTTCHGDQDWLWLGRRARASQAADARG
ncbi:MAG: hypothetical protein V9G13_03760 [Marmoricola sp.]